jgi:tetratricopeptide (TPR) repeat protein
MGTAQRLSLIVLLLCGTAGAAFAADPGALAGAKRALQEGMNHGDAQLMLKARGQLLSLLAAEPDSPLLHYWVAVADWRLVPMLSRHETAAAKRHCDDGLAQCDAALKANPRFAGALALKAGLQGMAIQFNGAAAITLAPEMVGNMTHAVEMAPADPRIRLLDGIDTFHMPSFFGGGADKALEKLKKAQALYAAEAVSDSTAPDWGRDDAFVWAGRCAMQLRDFAGARNFFRQALEANPANGWVRTSLLPAAEDSLARRDKS